MRHHPLALAAMLTGVIALAGCAPPEPPQVRVAEAAPDPAVVGEGGSAPPSAIPDPAEPPADQPPADDPPVDDPPVDEPPADEPPPDEPPVEEPPAEEPAPEATAPTCDEDAVTGDYCAGDKVSHGAEDTLYRCNGPGPATVRETCEHGCVVAPPGQDDYCAAGECAIAALLRWGLAPRASDQMRCASVSASRITQTIGSAAASAGYHAQDGTISGAPYCAATDLSVSGMTQTQIRALLGRLADGGFAAFYRWPGHDGWPSSQAPHIHAVYAGVAMKWQLDGQVEDWLAGRNGLASHTSYTFWQPSSAQQDHVRALFNAHN